MTSFKDDLPYLEWTEPDSGELVRLYGDANKDETANLPAIVTDYPVEVGSKRTDNYRKECETKRVSLFFSGSPLRADLDPDFTAHKQNHPLIQGHYPSGAPPYTPGGLRQGIIAAAAFAGSALGLSAQPASSFDSYVFDTDPAGRFKKAIETIRSLQERGILVTVKQSFDRLENMSITNAAAHRSAETGDGGELELDLKEVRLVTSDITFGAPLPKEPRAIPAKAGVNAGAGASVVPQQKKTALKGTADSW